MNKKYSTFLALLLAVLMVFNCGAVVNADTSTASGSDETTAQGTTDNSSTDISEKAVDSITIKKKDGTDSGGTIENWENFEVLVTFSEDDADGNQKSGLDIQGGDTITVNWTAPTGIKFAGNSDTFDLYTENGTAIATVVVTNDNCTITFNNNVNSLQHVSCTMYFFIYVSGDLNASDTTGTVSSGSISTEVEVVESESSTSSAFFHKSAMYSTDGSNTITWSIWLNENHRMDLSGEIDIVDTLPDTETFDSFVYYTSEDLNGNWEGISYSLSTFNTGERSFSISENGKKIKITVPVYDESTTDEEYSISNLNTPVTGLIVFTTKSTASAGETVTNKAEVTYYTSGSNKHTVDDSESIAFPISNGTVTSTPLGSIQINKVVEGTKDPVQGVTFRAYKVNSESDHTRVSGWYDGADYEEVTTDKDGTASITDLPDGVYEIEEVTDDLPDWIAVPDTTSNYVTVDGTEKEVTIENSVKTGDITATKKWTKNDGTSADASNEDRTVYFQLYRDGTALKDTDLSDNQTAVQAVVTKAGESSAQVSWNDLPLYDNSGTAYTYTVKEVDADGNDYIQEGYTKTEDGLTVTNSKNTADSDITATKKWVENDGTTADTSDHPTVYFKLYRSVDGGDAAAVDDAEIKAVKTASGESSAEVTWSDLPETNSAGQEYTYSVKEVDADGNDYIPKGYTKSEDGLTVTNKKNITYSDVKATIKWVKNDGTTADTSDHPTVYFKLYRSVDGKDAEAVSKAEINKIMTASGKSIAMVTRTDLSVSGAELKKVKTASGKSTATVTWADLPDMDSAGHAYTYSVKEVDADGNDYTPPGYTKSEDGLTVTNRKNITYSDITATKKWTKYDGTTADTSTHPTIYFQLYRNGTALTDDDLTDDQAAIQEVKTASGESTSTVTWTDLPDTDSAGNAYTYTVKEVDADGNDYTPSGYTKSEDGLTVTNKLNQQVASSKDNQNATQSRV